MQSFDSRKSNTALFFARFGKKPPPWGAINPLLHARQDIPVSSIPNGLAS
jgi:hypothetical protein